MASDSKNQLIQRPISENPSTKKNINLFPKQSECSHVSCYCEENVYKLCQDVASRHPNEIHKGFVVFVSNPSRTVPLWRQRAGKDEDRLVIWDYHVIFLYHPEPEKCLVYDLDSELPFPTYVHKYVTETFRTDHILKPDYFRYFRVIPANEFLKEFASDRRHMKRPDGTWIKPPPNYPAIQTARKNSCINHGSKVVFQVSRSGQSRKGSPVHTFFRPGKQSLCCLGIQYTIIATQPMARSMCRENLQTLLNSANVHNLEDYIQMDSSKGPGQVLSLTQFVQRFYKPAT